MDDNGVTQPPNCVIGPELIKVTCVIVKIQLQSARQ